MVLFLGKGANIPVLRAVVFKIVLKCYCFSKTGLSSFLFSWERRLEKGRGAGRAEWRRGEWVASGAGSWCVERMWRVLHLRSAKGMLWLGTLTTLTADDFLVCSPKMIRL